MSNRPVLSTTCDGRCKALDRIVVHVTRYRLFVCLTQYSQWRTVWTYILALGYIHMYCRPHHLTQETGVQVCTCWPYTYMQYMWPLSTVTHYCILHKDSQFTIYIHTYVYGMIIHECAKATQSYVITRRTHFSSSCITALMRVWKMAQRTSLGFSCS